MLNEVFGLRKGKVQRVVSSGTVRLKSTLQNRADAGLDARSAWWQSFLRGRRPVVPASVDDLTIVDAFCGSGGLSLGVGEAARALGYRPLHVAAIDTDAAALEVHRHNFATRQLINQSVSGLVDFSVINEGANVRFAYPPECVCEQLAGEKGVDIFLAGPPCEGHSNLNNHTRRHDPRNLLYLAAVALGVSLDARIIIIENVPTVKNAKGGVVEKALGLLKSAGYGISSATIKADALGAAQRRTRFFIVALRRSLDLNSDYLETGIAKQFAPSQSVAWAIGDLLNVERANVLDGIVALSPENRARIDYLFDQGLYDLPDKRRPVCHQQGTTYTSVYGRLNWDLPAQTITSGFNTPGQGRYVHPKERRVITAREAARLQFFPDSFDWFPSSLRVYRSNLAKWIGDAVPPILGYSVALAAIAADTSVLATLGRTAPE